MLRKLATLTVVLCLAFVTACSSKKKNADGDGLTDGTGSDSAQVSQEAFSFNANGSDSGQINGLNTIRFPYDSSTLDSEARATLAANADWIKANPKVSVQVEGHCDSRGSVEYNLALGERRAKAVKSYLVSLGIAANRMTIISFGKEKLLEIGDTEEVHSRNRRANFVPMGN